MRGRNGRRCVLPLVTALQATGGGERKTARGSRSCLDRRESGKGARLAMPKGGKPLIGRSLGGRDCKMGLVRKLLSSTNAEAAGASAPPVAETRSRAGVGKAALPPQVAKRRRLLSGGLGARAAAGAPTKPSQKVLSPPRFVPRLALARPRPAAPRTAARLGLFSTAFRRRGAGMPPESLRKKRTGGGCTWREDVGAADESKKAHLARHAGGKNLDCPRCRFYAFGVAWRKAYGGQRREAVDGLKACPAAADGEAEFFWLQERPSRWGGKWALGCAFCRMMCEKSARKKFPAPDASGSSTMVGSDARWRGRGDDEAMRGRSGTRWARYEVRPRTLQAANIAQHLQSDEHLAAERAFFLPDAPEVERVAAKAAEDERELLRGAVPQLPDWLRLFRMVTSPVSFRSAALASKTEHYIRSIRAGPVQRRAMAQMVRVMAEVLRTRKRAWVRGAYSITLSIDDKGPYRLIRFKVDAAGPGLGEEVGGLPRKARVGEEAAGTGAAGAAGLAAVGEAAATADVGRSTSPGARAGVLGVFHTGHNLEPEDFEEDYSERMLATVVEAIRRFCTPRPPGRLGDGECDEELVRHFMSSVRVYMADGGLSVQKCGALLQRSCCPNLIIVARDPTHYIRIACRDPLHREERFAAQWSRLFDSRHALMADIKNSEQWQARLQACQRRVVAVDGAQGGGLTSILKHFSFAKQRFDSFVGPRRKYICLLQAIVMLLCGLAGDPRQSKDIRDRAEEALDAITPADTLACGMAADFAEECLDFIRRFDVGDHDCAKSASQKRKFQRALKVLFLDGYIYAAPTSAARGGQIPSSPLATASPAREYDAPSQLEPADPGRWRRGQVPAQPPHAQQGGQAPPRPGGGEAPEASSRPAAGRGGGGPGGGEAPRGPSPAAAPKTLTAVALEQMEEMRVFYYGRKRKMLWSRDASLEATEILRSMQSVCKATLARLDADMAPTDLLMQFEALNLAEWQETKEAHRSASGPAAGQEEPTLARRRRAQENRLRRLGSALRLNETALVEQFDRALVAALRMWRRMRDAHRAQNKPPPDNRAIWAAILREPGLAPQEQAAMASAPASSELQAVLRLYLSVADTTGNVERNLGDVALLCARHLGPLDPSGRTVSDLLEVYLDGPQREEDVAGKAAAGTAGDNNLRFTPFSRQCQQMWIHTHGRRFCLPVAPRRAASGRPRSGTDNMVQAMQRAASAELLDLASASAPAATPSIFGGSLEDYRAREGVKLPSSKALDQFCARTKATRKAKREQAARPAGAPVRLQGPRAGLLARFKGGGIPGEPDGGAAQDIAQGLLARLRLRKKRVPLFVVRGPLPRHITAHFAVLQAVQSAPAADLFAVPSTEDLDRAPLPPHELHAWLYIVALGKSVVPMGGLQPDTRPSSHECLGHAAAAKQRPAELVLTQCFVQRFGRLAGALQDLAARSSSKWRVTRAPSVAVAQLAQPEGAKPPRILHTTEDLQAFLRAVRVFARTRGAHGTYSKSAMAKSDPARRGGVAARARRAR